MHSIYIIYMVLLSFEEFILLSFEEFVRNA